MDTQPTILVIDDNATSRKFATRALTGLYTIECAESAAEGLLLADEILPDVILMDVEMPGINGYEACDILKQSSNTQHIPVIFVSSLGTLRSRMQGYEAGGDDYLVKPFEKDELLAKLQLLTKQSAAQTELNTQAQEAQKMAHQAMTGSHELGQAMLFITQCQETNHYGGLAKHLLSFIGNMGLNCSLVIKGHNGEHSFSSSGNIPPLEAELISLLRGEKRFHDFGARTQINFPNLSLLIKNMPLSDMERYGRIKDLLPSLLSTLNTRITALGLEQALEQQTIALMKSFDTIRITLGDLGTSLQQKQQGSTDVMRNMLNLLGEKLPMMGLEDDQEAYILDHIAAAIESATDIKDDAERISTTFDSVLTKLQQLIDTQTQIVSSLSQQTDIPDKGEDDGYTMDVELF